MKQFLSIFVLAFLGMSLSAQVTDHFPVQESFNNDISESEVILGYTQNWKIDWQPENSSCPLGSLDEDDMFIYLYGYPEVYNNEEIETYAFEFNDRYIKLSFVYANPKWVQDYDYLEVGYRQSAYDNYTYRYNFSEPNNNDWTRGEIILPGPALYQFSFRSSTHQGFGVYIDNIVVETFNAVDIAENSIQDIRVYPNPTSDILIIDGADGELVRVYDNMGRVVKEERYNDNLNVRDLSQGVYVVSVAGKNIKFLKK